LEGDQSTSQYGRKIGKAGPWRGEATKKARSSSVDIRSSIIGEAKFLLRGVKKKAKKHKKRGNAIPLRLRLRFSPKKDLKRTELENGAHVS